MVQRIERADGPPRSRLESWLVRKVQGGGLKTLPRYHPTTGRGDRSPERYARVLLAGFRKAKDDPPALERLKDDGRAFRSWAESALALAPHGVDVLAGCHSRQQADRW